MDTRHEDNGRNEERYKVFKMTRPEQDQIYQAIGKYLTNARLAKKMTISQLSTKCGEQFNTVSAIEGGCRFMFHHFIWIEEILGVNISEMMTEVTSVKSKKEETIADYI